MVETTLTARFATDVEARDANAMGWNLRCGRCGSFGASWLREIDNVSARPGWGSLSLCSDCTAEWEAEAARHSIVVRDFQTVRFASEAHRG